MLMQLPDSSQQGFPLCLHQYLSLPSTNMEPDTVKFLLPFWSPLSFRLISLFPSLSLSLSLSLSFPLSLSLYLFISLSLSLSFFLSSLFCLHQYLSLPPTNMEPETDKFLLPFWSPPLSLLPSHLSLRFFGYHVPCFRLWSSMLVCWQWS